MKKILFLATLAGLVALTSCKEPKPEAMLSVVPPDSAEIAGGDVTFEIKSNVDWTVETPAADTWYTAAPKNGNGDGTVTLTVEPNTGAKRTSIITVKGGGITRSATLVQEGIEPDRLDANSPAAVAADATSVKFAISANVAWEVAEATEIDWITGIAPAEGDGDGEVTVTITANAGDTERRGDILITEKDGELSKTVTITQKGVGEPAGLEYTDIPEGSVSFTGTPSLLQNAGPSSWTTTMSYIRVDDQLPEFPYDYYQLGWGGTGNAGVPVLIRYEDGKVYVENSFYICENQDGTALGRFTPIYIANNAIVPIDDEIWEVTYDKATNTMDFSGTYEGSDVYFVVQAYNADTEQPLNSCFNDGYPDAVGVFGGGAAPTAGVSGKQLPLRPNYITGLYDFDSEVATKTIRR